jgi:RNA polymerase sigma-70 factor (ECF subfamily)
MNISTQKETVAGMADGFQLQIKPLGEKLQRYATRILRDEEAARDVVQDVFCRLWQKMQRTEAIENVEAFAMQMARNCCFDYLKSNRSPVMAIQKIKIDQKEYRDLQHEIELVDSASLVRDLVAGLPETQRMVMQLRDIEQYGFDEISQMTSLKYTAIQANLSRARKKVRDAFLKHSEYGIN